MNETLIKWGLSERFYSEATLYPELYIARVTRENRGQYQLIGENGSFLGQVSGKFIHSSEINTDYPAVGDWVMVNKNSDSDGVAIIQNVLTRKSAVARQAAGEAKTKNVEQIIASNIDTLLLCMALDNDFNIRRLERYLAIAWDSMATPVVVLTKADLCDDVATKLASVENIAIGVDVVVLSGKIENGYAAISPYITEGKTLALIGSSGVGKSTLINAVLGEVLLDTGEVREDDSRGRHTTTFRQMLLVPTGGIIVDTPGMRELNLSSGDFSSSFSDIEELTTKCKFADCSHKSEPGCAVIAALDNDSLDKKRYENYKKLLIEASYEGLTSSQINQAKMKRMFGSSAQHKNLVKEIRNKAKNKYK